MLAILFGFAFTIATCYFASRILLARFRSLAVFILATIGGARPAIFAALGAVLISRAIGQKQPVRPSLPPLPPIWKWMFTLIFIAYTVLY
ncbi:MAG: hypothetical protein ACR2NN_16885 [Bryobacteraceae bacterium]